MVLYHRHLNWRISHVSAELASTPLHSWHVAHGGRMVDFAGWSMPVQYSSIVAEHQATRRAGGLFDVSHMGRIRFDGPGAAAFLDSLLTRRVLDMKPGQVRYGLVTNETGGILDDVLVYRIADQSGEDYHVLVVNASNREKILAWIDSRLPTSRDFQHYDVTKVSAMIAVQGPLALQIVQPLVAAKLDSLKYYSAVETIVTTKFGGTTIIASRTGYTGEDGCELLLPSNIAAEVWEKTLAAGKDRGVMAAGLGCRDTLRLEAAMPLYGHELNESISPIQAGLNFAVNLEGRTFPGRDVLVGQKQNPPVQRRVGLQLEGKRVPREGYAVLSDGQNVGVVTSGTYSPTLDRPIAMAYVNGDVVNSAAALAVDIRGQAVAANVVPLPFYRRSQ